MTLSSKEPNGAAPSDFLIVGSLGSSYGIHGWVKVTSFTDPAENILQYEELYFLMQGQWEKAVLDGRKLHGNHVLLKLSHCETPEKAKTYTGTQIAIERSQLSTLEHNEYYWTDLENCRVYNKQGNDFGIVTHLINTGARDILVIRGERERLVPFIQGLFVLEVDINQKKIIVDWDAEF